MLKSTSIATADAVSEYLLELADAGRSARTTAAYGHHLAPMVECAPDLPCDQDDVRRALVSRQQSQHSRGQQLRAIRRFLKWADARYSFGGNPADGVMDIKAQAEPPRVFSDAEVDRIMATATTPRDRVMILVMLDTGIRVGELANLQPEDVEGDWLLVTGKTGPRRVPISGWVAREFVDLAGGGDVVWHGRGGKPMSVGAIKKVYEKVFRDAGIDGRRLGPHTLRHTFASRWVEDGGDVAALQVILGHATLEQTMAYVTLAGTHALRQHAAHAMSRRYAPGAAGARSTGTRTVVDPMVALAPVASHRCDEDPGQDDEPVHLEPEDEEVDEEVDELFTALIEEVYERGRQAGWLECLDQIRGKFAGDDGQEPDHGALEFVAIAAVEEMMSRMSALERRLS